MSTQQQTLGTFAGTMRSTTGELNGEKDNDSVRERTSTTTLAASSPASTSASVSGSRVGEHAGVLPERVRDPVESAFAEPVGETGAINNVNVNSGVGVELSLSALAKDFEVCEHDERRGYVTLDLNGVEASIRVYASGGVTVTGTTTADGVMEALRGVHEFLNSKVGVETLWEPIEVSNIVVGYKECELNLNQLSIVLGRNVQYEPETFPGALYRGSVECDDLDDGSTVMAFSSGQLNVTGASSTGAARRRRDELMRLVDKYGVSVE